MGMLRSKLKSMAKKYGTTNGVSVVVGYSAEYAIYVHEDLQANHPRGGEAQFLAKAAKAMNSQIPSLVRKYVKNGVHLISALTIIGLKIQRDSQKLVPVDTGNLKGSAKTFKEKK